MPCGDDNALTIDDKGASDDSLAGLAEHFFLFDDAVFFADGPIGIAQQGEEEIKFFSELLVRGDAVAAHTEDVCFSGCEGADFITEIAGFLGSPGCVVFWVKVKNDGLSLEVFQSNFLLLVGFEAESRRFFSDI